MVCKIIVIFLLKFAFPSFTPKFVGYLFTTITVYINYTVDYICLVLHESYSDHAYLYSTASALFSRQSGKLAINGGNFCEVISVAGNTECNCGTN